MKIKKLTVLFLSVISIISCFTLTAQANSGPAWYKGADSSGAIIMTDNCPVSLQKEVLTFDIDNLPSVSGNFAPNTVTADYEYFNPTDELLSLRMAFPCGIKPNYAKDIDDRAMIDISLDGVETNAEVRFTDSDSHGYKSLDFKSEVHKIRDKKSVFIDENATVTFYSYNFVLPYNQEFEVLGRIKYGENVRVFVFDAYDLVYYGDGCATFTTYLNNKSHNCFLCVIGDVNNADISWFDAGEGNYVGNSIKAELVENKTLSFSDFVDNYFKFDDEVNPTDRHNAVIDRFFIGCGNVIVADEYRLDFRNSMLKWLLYDMEIQAKSTVKNRVTAPIYPSISGRNSRFEYTYYLSPASEWSDFNSLTVNINTPYYIDRDIFDKSLIKTDSGYTVEFDSLPKGELYFTVNSNYEINNCIDLNIGSIILSGVILFFLILGVVLLVIGIKGYNYICGKHKNQ